MGHKPKTNVSAANTFSNQWNESPREAESRQAANFSEIEMKLPQRFPRSEMNLIDKATSLLGSRNPFSKKAKPGEHEVWLLDNTAYRPINKNTGELEPWTAEFVACYFAKGRRDVSSAIGNIADVIGLDGDIGSNPEAQRMMEERLGPFVQAIAPARTVEIKIPAPDANGKPHTRQLGPSNANGISSQLLLTGGSDAADGKTVTCSAADKFPELQNSMRFAGVDGWAVVCDIDDTIKKTMTPDPLGVLKSTFIDAPELIRGMPELFKILHEQFENPALFYLSASPYNLYPFLHRFINDNFKQGTIILRDSSWMYFGGLLQSLTEGVQEYKTERIAKIHSWIPRRKVICIGDSTQSDPEAYAEAYKAHPEWIKAIYIRKVVDAPFMDTKNSDKRFADAFKDIPEHVWKIFEQPEELADHVKHVAGQAHLSIVGALQGWFCKTERSMQTSAVQASGAQPGAGALPEK